MQEMKVPSLGQEDPLERKWHPTPVFLPGKSHGQRSLAGYSPWGGKELDMTETTKQQQRECTYRRRESEGITEAEGRVAWPQAKKCEQPPEDNRGKEGVVPSSFGGNTALVDLEFLVLEVLSPEL